MITGAVLAIFGAALAALLCGIGSAKALQMVGEAGAGVLAEHPERFGSVLLLQALPGTQGIYGLLIAFIIFQKIGLLAGQLVDLSLADGLTILFGALPIALVGFFSALAQGRTAVAGVHIIAKQPGEMAKGMTLAAMVETYAVLALLASFLIIQNLPL